MRPPPVLPVLLALLAVPALGCSSRPGAHPVEGVLDARRERVITFDEMVDDLATVPMVYVGESHTNPDHHAIQRRVIEALAERRPVLMVGMEMLQRPYQEVLDRWSAGELEEGEFLRDANWYGQWSDWGHYAPILRTARDRGLRVVGLNVDRGIIREINRGGLEALPPWMRVQVPDTIDTSVRAHEKSIREVFFSHPGMESAEERFRRFYQAQCTWDETMAESAVRALEQAGRDDAAIVVLAGSMHVKNFHSIPERARRRNGLDYRVVLPMERDAVPEGGVKVGPGRPADYVLFTGPTRPASPPRLGVVLRGGDSLVKEVLPGSAAEGAGLKAGDVLVGIDALPVRDTVDIRLAMESRSPGDAVALRWTREGEAMEGSAMLTAPPPLFAPPTPRKEEGKDAPAPAPSK